MIYTLNSRKLGKVMLNSTLPVQSVSGMVVDFTIFP